MSDTKKQVFFFSMETFLYLYQIVGKFLFNKSWHHGGRARNTFDSSNLPLGQKALSAYLRHLDDVYILRVYDNLYNDSTLIVVCMSRYSSQTNNATANNTLPPQNKAYTGSKVTLLVCLSHFCRYKNEYEI